MALSFMTVKGNIDSADFVNFLFITGSIDTTMHFAAQTHTQQQNWCKNACHGLW